MIRMKPKSAPEPTSPELGIPRRFYEQKVSPGAAEHLGMSELLERKDDVTPAAMEVYARWNDGKFVKLGRTDEAFLAENMWEMESDLRVCADCERVMVAVHHLPFAAMLPPVNRAQWEFSKAYLGAASIGRALLRYENVRVVACGHSHFEAEAQVGHTRAMNIGSGYRQKRFRVIEL